MASTKEIKNRIESVRDTKKITNAMYLISSTKLRKARRDLDATRPYFEALGTEIKRIFRTAEYVESPYFYPPDNDTNPLDGTYACLVVTADKGLAGAYNQNVLKEAEKMRQDHPDTVFYVVGEYGRHYFTQHKIPIEQSFLYTAQNPTMDRAREISSILLERFEKGDFAKIFIIYTDLKSSISSEANGFRLLPFHRSTFATPSHTKEKAMNEPLEFVPSVEVVLNSIIQSYVSGYIYSALIDSFCSEQNARMTAMDAANKNAEKLLSELSLEYNRVRQAAITQEITEVSAGAKAQRAQRAAKAQRAMRGTEG
ncbi:MAG TPA: ATP synthase F1 subunit gamma [Candidatus Faecivivens stercoravium]|uniref:ATP synthase gamma chain n=1 Tax=Candidatus Faecivivens stercoravium TaxID=2840803 RepID=A0A9D1DWH2_9FIRM|nr:ATP synthase F1 subunit gamma [Candidatus Faecivivens stercoravium]